MEEARDYVYVIIEHDYKSGGYHTVGQTYYTDLARCKDKIKRLNAACPVPFEPFDYIGLCENK